MIDLKALTANASLPPGLVSDAGNLLGVVWRGRRLIAGCVAGCFLLAVFYVAVSPRVYQATAKLLVFQHGGRPLGVAGADQGRLAEGADDYIPTHAMIIRSPIVVDRAIEAVGLANLPSLGTGLTRERAVQRAIKNLTVTRPDRNAKILQVDYRCRSPEEAVRLVQAVASSYRTFLEDVYQRNNSEVVMLMTKARDDLNRELKGLEQKYLDFRRQSPLLTSDSSGKPLISRRIDEWNRATNDAMVRAIQLKAQLELGQKLAKNGLGLWSIAYAMDQLGGGSAGGLGPRTAAFSPAPPSDYLRQLNQEQQQLAERYGPQSTRVREIQETISSVQQQSKATRSQIEHGEIGDLLGSIELSLKALDAMRKDMTVRFDGDLDVARKTDIALLTDANLKNELERHRMLFNTVVDQLKQAKLAGDYSGIWCETIEPANALPKPVRPLVSLTLAASLAAGGLLGLAAAVGANLLDPRIRSVEEAKRVLSLPLLAEVPLVPPVPGDPDPAGEVGLVSHTRPRSPSAEAFKVARANLDLARRNHGTKVVLVTSPQAGEGKSVAASNLAISLAQAGRKVLLVDADLRRPAQHDIHDLMRDRGLTHILRDLLPVHRVVQPSALPTLSVIASGPEVANPAEILSSPFLHSFLAQVRDGYDAVIVDSPALLSVADTSITAAVADGVVLVVRNSATRRHEAARALEILKGLGTPVLGVLVNGAGPQAAAAPAAPEAEGAEGAEAAAAPRSPISLVAADLADRIPWLLNGANGRAGHTEREDGAQ